MYAVRFRLDKDGRWYDHEMRLMDYEFEALKKIHDSGMLKICWVGRGSLREMRHVDYEFEDCTKEMLQEKNSEFELSLA